jgi:hypothetical protein
MHDIWIEFTQEPSEPPTYADMSRKHVEACWSRQIVEANVITVDGDRLREFGCERDDVKIHVLDPVQPLEQVRCRRLDAARDLFRLKRKSPYESNAHLSKFRGSRSNFVKIGSSGPGASDGWV